MKHFLFIALLLLSTGCKTSTQQEDSELTRGSKSKYFQHFIMTVPDDKYSVAFYTCPSEVNGKALALNEENFENYCVAAYQDQNGKNVKILKQHAYEHLSFKPCNGMLNGGQLS